MKICVVHQTDGSDVRVEKICRSLVKRHSVLFLGWQKGDERHEVSAGESNLFKYKTKQMRGTSVGLLFFYFWLIFQILRRRPNLVYCVNEELAFLLAPIKALLNFRLVCDIFDPFADRKSLSRFHSIFAKIQTTGRLGADALIAVDESRFNRLEPNVKAKAFVVPNYPEVQNLPQEPIGFERESGCIYVAYLGALSKGRGARHLSECLDRCPWLRVLCAGRAFDDAAQELVTKRQVHYFGVVSATTARGIMKISDVVLCIYDPAIVNNLYASPNKIYDAMSVGRKILINEEVLISRFVKESGVGSTYKYGDIDDLIRAFSLFQSNTVDQVADEEIIDLVRKKYSWESAEPSLYAAIGE